MRHIISMLLQNEAGALARVAGMFSARGYNIESLCVAPTQEPTLSRLTLVTTGPDAVIEQILKQSRKLVDVVEVMDLNHLDHLENELAILKLRVDGDCARRVVDCVRRHGALILDEVGAIRTVQIAGNGAEVNAFLDEIAGLAPVEELVRSGTAAIERGRSRLTASL
ncbi:MAG: acetolactate synthase small subunit [Gammaproteobacteria bacterium]|nr:acetolactate synthase small subunit [Gammaproteobacteria bacterium]